MKLETFWLISGTGVLIVYSLGKIFDNFFFEWVAFAGLVVMVTGVLELHLDLVKKLSLQKQDNTKREETK